MKGTALSSYTLILLKILPYKALSFFFPSEMIFLAVAISVLTGLLSGSNRKAIFKSTNASSGRPEKDREREMDREMRGRDREIDIEEVRRNK